MERILPIYANRAHLARFSRKTALTWQQNIAKIMQNRAGSRTFMSL
jgi:hypothetical protein